jgi:hypothetical protein
MRVRLFSISSYKLLKSDSFAERECFKISYFSLKLYVSVSDRMFLENAIVR